MKNIVAISGPKGVGKTSLCKFLHASYERARKNLVLSSGDKIPESCSLIQYAETGRTQVLADIDGVNCSVSLRDSALSGIFSFATKVKNISVDVLCLDADGVFGSEKGKNMLTQYLWENLPIWIRWINSPNRCFTSIEDGESYCFNDIVNEDAFFNICVNKKLLPSNLRSGFMTNREIMQILGTDIFRKLFDENIWVNSTINEILKSDYELCLIDDMRFNSEAKSVISNGGYIVILNRTVNFSDVHESERGITDVEILEHERVFHIDPYENIMDKNRRVCDILDEIIFKKATNIVCSSK